MPPETKTFYTESYSKLEPVLIERLCVPVIERIPEGVSPNAISLVTHLLCWVSAGLAAASPWLTYPYKSLALLAAGVVTLAAMVGDNLDGMHARRTGRTSKLGEMMDHWLDTVAVPLVTAGVVLALQLPAWSMAPVLVLTTMVFHAQMVLYHHTGRFLHPHTSGSDAQFGTAVAYVLLAVFFTFIDRGTPWVQNAIELAGILAVIIHLKIIWFYYSRLGWLFLRHVPYILLGAGFGALYVSGIINTQAFVLSVLLLSFRSTGTYVLCTVIGRRTHAVDPGIPVWIALIAYTHYHPVAYTIAGYAVQDYVQYLACIYMLSRNLFDFVRHFPELKPDYEYGEARPA